MNCLTSIRDQIINDSARVLVDVTGLIPASSKDTVEHAMNYCGLPTPYDYVTSVHSNPNGEIWYRCEINENLTFVIPTDHPEYPKTLKALASEPWNYQKPNTNDSDGAFYLIPRTSDADMMDPNKWADLTSTKLNLKLGVDITSGREDISTLNFKVGDFTPHPYVYVTVYKSRVYSIFIVLETKPIVWMRMCSGIGITPTNTKYVPTVYSSSNGSNCDTLLSCACMEDPDKTYSTDPLCGCYQYYVDNVVVGSDSKLSKYLKAKSVSLPPACSLSCTLGKAYQPSNLKTCNFTICQTDVGSGSELADSVTINQNCGSDNNPSDNHITPSDEDDLVKMFEEQNRSVITIEMVVLSVLIACVIYCLFFYKRR